MKRVEDDFFEQKLSDIKKKFPENTLFYLNNWNPAGYYAKSIDSIYLNSLKIMAFFNFSSKKKLSSLKFGSIGNTSIYHKGQKNLLGKLLLFLTQKLINKSFSYELENLLGSRFKIENILFHSTSSINSKEFFSYSEDPKVNSNHINFFHYDTTPPNVVKIMIYLSKHVSSENGAFRYIPESFKLNNKKKNWYLSKVVRDNYFNTDYKSLLRFYSLKKTYQKRNTFAYLLEDNVYKKKLDNAAVVFESPLNMILFNPLGIHTGGFCYKGKRKALQVTLTKCN